MTFHLDIIDTKRAIYSGEAKSLTIPALAGEMTVLPEHMAIVTPVGLGEVFVKTPDKDLTLTIGKGIFSMDKNRASLLIEDARYTEEISEVAAEEAKKKAEEIIEKGIQGEDLEAAMSVIRRSLVDLKTVRRRKKLRV